MYDEKYLIAALDEARKAARYQDVPVGCVIVKDGKIIARAHNRKVASVDPVAHSEILAIRKAAKKLYLSNLSGCDMYVTFEPCLMCVGAIIGARVDNVYYGARDLKFPTVDKIKDIPVNHKVNFVYVESSQCSAILTDFFKELRNGKRGNKSRGKDSNN